MGWMITYIIVLIPYMKKHNIKTMKDAKIEYENYGNKLFLVMSWYWIPYWINKILNKNKGN